jgi:hypothetical protein
MWTKALRDVQAAGTALFPRSFGSQISSLKLAAPPRHARLAARNAME